MNRSESITKLVPALVKAKLAFRPAVKDATNPHFNKKYLSLDGVIEAIDAALLANGIIAMQPTRLHDGKTIVETTLFHESGEFISGDYQVTPSQAGPQGEGSGLTYARRYALMSMVGIAPEDDDAEAAAARSGGSGRSRAARSEPATEPDNSKDPNVIRARIAAVAKASGVSTQTAGDDFASWSQGTKITAADAALLLRYLDHINANGIAA